MWYQNPLQLITKVQAASNNTDDSQLLTEALPNLKERTELETIYTDGGHGGSEADTVLQEQNVEHIQTAIRGRSPNPEILHLADFQIKLNQDGKPVKALARRDRPSQCKPVASRKPSLSTSRLKSARPVPCWNNVLPGRENATRVSMVGQSATIICVSPRPKRWLPNAAAAVMNSSKKAATYVPPSKPAYAASNILFRLASYRCEAISG